MKLKCIAAIRHNFTGVVRLVETEEHLYDGDDEPNPYHWSEGNNSCDCNRRMLFEGRYIPGQRCGEGKYSVNLKKPDGTVYHREFPDA